MRGGFVACFGAAPASVAELERVADCFRLHTGKGALNEGHGLRIAMLVDEEDGPRVDHSSTATLVSYGASPAPLGDLEAGDARFAALESDGRQVVASRDAFGLAPLFYRHHGGATWFATEITPLVALGDTGPDTFALAAKIAHFPAYDRTGWTGIRRVLPGSRVTVALDGSVRPSTHWNPGAALGTYPGAWEDGVAQFRELLTEAVARCQTDSTGIMVSGGLDSGAVTVSVRRGDPQPHLVHVRFRTLPGTDEELFAAAVAGAVGAPLHTPEGPLTPWDPVEELKVTGGVLYDWLPFGIEETALASMAGAGIEVALDGHDGDGVVGHPGGEWGALFMRGQFGHLTRLARQHGVTRTATGVARDLLPPQVTRRGIRLRGVPTSPSQVAERYFRGPLLASLRATDHYRWGRPFKRWRARQLQPLLPQATVNMEQKELLASSMGIDMRHPFASRRLAELALSMRLASGIEPIRQKSLLRDALADALPEVLRERVTKSDYMEVVRRRVSARRCRDLIQDSGVRLPHIDYDRLFGDIDSGVEPPLFVLVYLTRAHAFVGAREASWAP